MIKDEGSNGHWIREAVAAYQRPLTSYAARLIGDGEAARDVVQDVFLRLCAADRGRVEGHLAEWLYTVCRNRSLDVRRKEKAMERIDETSPARDGSPAGMAEMRDTHGRAIALLGRLPENQREVIRLKFQHGMSYAQIASITNLSAGNVGFLIHTGLKRIREAMEPRMHADKHG